MLQITLQNFIYRLSGHLNVELTRNTGANIREHPEHSINVSDQYRLEKLIFLLRRW
jgi:hypothetical protein